MIKKVIGFFFTFSFLCLISFSSVFAQGAPPVPPPVAVFNPVGANGCSATEISTAIGCIPLFGAGNTLNPFLSFFLLWGMGIAGGIAFLLILYAGFQIMTSAGNPQRVQSGKELLGAAISGILLLIFSTFILRIVGVDILKIF